MKVILADVETTGGSHSDQVIELAYVELLPLHLFRTASIPFVESSFYNERFMPSVPINPHAYECHGITYKELLGKRKSDEVELPKDTKVLIGHNISFDWRFLGKPEVNLICTLDLAKKMSKFLGFECSNHKLDTLAKELPELPPIFEVTKYHSAKNDILKNIAVLQALLKHLPAIEDWQSLWHFQQSLKTPAKKAKK